MTLTEEQRAAIHAVSGLLTAIGCPQCHSYLQKNYTHHIEVLRAMIDSSEHIREPPKMVGFDLERARGLRDFLQGDCAEVGDVWAEMIAEIERLQGFETAARDLNNDLIRIAGERDELAARIQELEDALIEQEARFQYYVQNENCESWPEARRRYPELNEKYLKIARQHLQAEGKIGPDARIAAWQITEERKAALKRLYGLLVIRYKYSYPDETETLRAMLEEVEE